MRKALLPLVGLAVAVALVAPALGIGGDDVEHLDGARSRERDG